MDLLIIIVLFLIEICTINLSSKIDEKLALKEFLEIYNRGYKIELDKYSKYIDKIRNKKYSKRQIIISRLIKITPFLNITYALFYGLKNINSILKDDIINESKEPMTIEEINEYKKYKSDKEKLVYLDIMYHKDSNKTTKLSSDILNVKRDKLIALAYTYEEVLKLIEASQNNSLIGSIGDVNVAIIGIPTLNKKYNKVTFSNEGKQIYNFIQYNETEAKGKTYLVYPFTEECEIDIQKTVDDIIKNRFDDESNNQKYNPFPIVDEKPKTIRHIIR